MYPKSSILLYFSSIFLIYVSCEESSVGYTISIKCPISGSPKPQIKWFKDNIELTENRFTVTKEGVLEISNIRFADQGDYLCNAQNKFISLNATRRLIGIFTGKNNVLQANTVDYEVREGDPIELKFMAETKHVLPITVNWTHNTTLMEFPINDEFKDPLTQHTVTNWLTHGGYEKVKGYRQTRNNPNETKISDSWIMEQTHQRDSGIYICTASSAHFGNAVIQRQFVVRTNKESEKKNENFRSEAVRFLKALPLSSSALHLSWEAPLKTFGNLVAYKISYAPLTREWYRSDLEKYRSDLEEVQYKSITDFRSTNIKLSNLEAMRHYEVTVQAVTLAGEGEASTIRMRTLSTSRVPIVPRFRHLKHTDFNFKYLDESNSKSNDTALIIWEPWINQEISDEISMGSYFYVKYRLRYEEHCFNIIYEFNEDYVFIRGLQPLKPYEFIVGSVDDKYSSENRHAFETLDKPIEILPCLFVISLILMTELTIYRLTRNNWRSFSNAEESIPLDNAISNVQQPVKVTNKISVFIILMMNSFVFIGLIYLSYRHRPTVQSENILCPESDMQMLTSKKNFLRFFE